MIAVVSQLMAQMVYYFFMGGEPGNIGILLLVAYGYCLVYLLTNGRVRDTFSRIPV